MDVTKNIRLLTWFNFFTDFKLYAPIAILYFAEVSGSFALGMTVFSVAMISSALFEIPTGIFSDMIGRKKTLIWGAFAAVLSFIFTRLVAHLEYWLWAQSVKVYLVPFIVVIMTHYFMTR